MVLLTKAMKNYVENRKGYSKETAEQYDRRILQYIEEGFKDLQFLVEKFPWSQLHKIYDEVPVVEEVPTMNKKSTVVHPSLVEKLIISLLQTPLIRYMKTNLSEEEQDQKRAMLSLYFKIALHLEFIGLQLRLPIQSVVAIERGPLPGLRAIYYTGLFPWLLSKPEYQKPKKNSRPRAKKSLDRSVSARDPVPS
jgi:hypothetical protein